MRIRKAPLAIFAALGCLLASFAVQAKGATAEEDPSPLALAEQTLSSVRETRYSHRTHIDQEQGVYVCDCSGFISHLLAATRPTAYAEVTYDRTRRKHPRAEDYHRLFASLSSSAADGWLPVITVGDLRPGDIIAWKRPPDSTSTNTGHVMLVRSAPHRSSERPNEWLVEVIDSTATPHAADTRPPGSTGLGAGVIGLLTDDTGRPAGYRVKGGRGRDRLTQIAFARPAP